MGEPGGVQTPSFTTEYIGCRRRTRGSETSQYPQEKKTNVIPQVAASERGRAQTHGHAHGGCGAPDMGWQKYRRTVWKGRPETVIARYSKYLCPLGSPRVPRGT